MLYLVGIGLKPEHITQEALGVLKRCKKVYMENYTSTYAEGEVSDLEELIENEIAVLGRKEVEEEFGPVLENAKKEDVALLVIGNPLTATTHTQILIDAKKAKVKVEVISGISIMNFVGKTGLSEYKFGRTVTIVYPQKNYAPDSFYDMIKKNREWGLHTVCLLDIQAEKNKLMSIRDAIEILEDIEKRKKGKILKEALLVAICAAGGKEEKICAGKSAELKKAKLLTPASLIVCSDLSENETEALEKLHGAKLTI